MEVHKEELDLETSLEEFYANKAVQKYKGYIQYNLFNKFANCKATKMKKQNDKSIQNILQKEPPTSSSLKIGKNKEIVLKTKDVFEQFTQTDSINSTSENIFDQTTQTIPIGESFFPNLEKSIQELHDLIKQTHSETTENIFISESNLKEQINILSNILSEINNKCNIFTELSNSINKKFIEQQKALEDLKVQHKNSLFEEQFRFELPGSTSVKTESDSEFSHDVPFSRKRNQKNRPNSNSSKRARITYHKQNSFCADKDDIDALVDLSQANKVSRFVRRENFSSGNKFKTVYDNENLFGSEYGSDALPSSSLSEEFGVKRFGRLVYPLNGFGTQSVPAKRRPQITYPDSPNDPFA